MFAHQGGMMDEGTAGEIAEINNKGIIAMCLKTSWGRTSLGQRAEFAESFWNWVLPRPPFAGCRWMPQNAASSGVLWVHCLQQGDTPSAGSPTHHCPRAGRIAGLDQPQPRLSPAATGKPGQVQGCRVLTSLLAPSTAALCAPRPCEAMPPPAAPPAPALPGCRLKKHHPLQTISPKERKIHVQVGLVAFSH